MSTTNHESGISRSRFEPPFPIFDGAVECRAVPGKGLAAFSLRNFAVDDIIGREKPLVWVPFHWPFNEQQSTEVDCRIEALSEADRELFFASANVYLDETTGQPVGAPTKAAGIFHTNSFDMPGATPGPSCGIFPQFARLNHSCKPNARQQFDAKTQTMILYADKSIALGDELHDSYTDLEANVTVRRDELMKYYHFLCDCRRCTKEQAKLDRTAWQQQPASELHSRAVTQKSAVPELSHFSVNTQRESSHQEINTSTTSDAVAGEVGEESKCSTANSKLGRLASDDLVKSSGSTKNSKPMKPNGWANMNKAQRLAWHKAQNKQGQASKRAKASSSEGVPEGESDSVGGAPTKVPWYEAQNRYARHIPPVSKLPEEGSLHIPSAAEREELVFEYDFKKYDFRAIVVDMFKHCNSLEDLALDGVDESGDEDKSKHFDGTVDGDEYGEMLSNLHRTHMAVTRCARVGGASGGRHGAAADLKGQYTRIMGESGKQPDGLMQLKARFHNTLLAFVRDVIAPLVGAAPDEVGFQRSPTFRLSFPSADPMGHPHCDAEYHHQPGELNFWLPLTAVWGSNSLFTESSPGQGDFHPLELGYGRGVRFWGNRCHHFCVPNASGATRVSLDFRVIAVHRHDSNFVDGRGKPGAFKLGEYYRLSSEVPAPQLLVPEVADDNGSAFDCKD